MRRRLDPGYLRNYCIETHSSASGLRLRLIDKRDLRVRRMKTRFGDRAFSADGPSYWNSLPSVLRAAYLVDSFKTGLKQGIFRCLLTVRRPCSGMAVLRLKLEIVVIIIIIITTF